MIPIRTFSGKKIAIFGLARSGLSAAQALLHGGAEIVAWDDNEAQRLAAKELELSIVDLYSYDWSDLDGCVVSPGVPLTHPAPHAIVQKALDNNVEVVGDLELFARELGQQKTRPDLICVTGTNGKSTTTSLVGHLFAEARINHDVGGNLGNAVLGLSEFQKRKAYVFEVSSYQLDLAPSLKPNISVLLNISPDHLDRHGDMEGYVGTKRKIFNNQGKSDTAIISVDDPHTSEICTQISRDGIGQVIPISVGKALSKGVYVLDGILFDALANPTTEVLDLHECSNLLGEHNWQNIAAAYAVGRATNIDTEVIIRAFRSFTGLPHRLEVVGDVNEVRFINDSKATNIDAAGYALASFENIYWIAGGRSKANTLDPLLPLMPRVRHAYLIGEAAQEFSKSLVAKTEVAISKTLGQAVKDAYEDALRERVDHPVILLSPACASFDQFADFEERGDCFRELVEKLVSAEIRGGAAA